MTRRVHFDRLDAIALAVLGGTVAVTLALLPRLPARLPIHFDLHGTPDAWATKGIAVAILPVLGLLTWGLVRYGALFLVRNWRERMLASPISAVALLTMLLLVAIHFAMIWSSLQGGASIGTLLAFLLGVFWIALGLLMPRVRRNPFVGVRTTWTLTSDENWARTHRFAGLTFTLAGVVGLLTAIAGVPAVGIAAIVIGAIAPVVYSWAVSKRYPPEA